MSRFSKTGPGHHAICTSSTAGGGHGMFSIIRSYKPKIEHLVGMVVNRGAQRTRAGKASLNIAQQVTQLLDYGCIGIAYDDIAQPALCPRTHAKRG
jgi:hypothetical protein